MNNQHSAIFKSLIKAYYENNFEETVSSILSDKVIQPKELSTLISALCGVEVLYNEKYVENLKKAISSYKQEHKIVDKVRTCSMDCADENGETTCQKSCPFNAILIDVEKHTTYIDEEKCTDCGLCVSGCPSGSILDKVEFLPLVNLLKNKEPVIAAVAPAIIGQFGDDVTMNQLRAAFKKMGFTDMVEVAFFADMLTLKEAVEFDHHVKTKEDLMITSCCCPMWVAMLKRVYSGLSKHVSPSISPMIAAGRVLKTLSPNCKVVFIGPCIAKKAEAKEKDIAGAIDFVLTFAELKDIFDTVSINPGNLEECISSEYASRGGRLYARTGGVSIAVGEAIERLFPEKFKLLNAIQADGVKNCKEILEKASKGEISANFIEGMGCVGGCVGGPKAIVSKEKGRDKTNEFAESSSIEVAVDSSCMNEILARIGIHCAEDFKDAKKIQIFEREF